MFSLNCGWINRWVNNWEVGDLRRHRTPRWPMPCIASHTIVPRHIGTTDVKFVISKYFQYSRLLSMSRAPWRTVLLVPSARWWDNIANWMEIMMASLNASIFRVTGHLCGEFTGPRWNPRTKASDAELWCTLMFPLICAWMNCWVNNRQPDDLRRHRAHYDVTVMVEDAGYSTPITRQGHWLWFALVWCVLIFSRCMGWASMQLLNEIYLFSYNSLGPKESYQLSLGWQYARHTLCNTAV